MNRIIDAVLVFLLRDVARYRFKVIRNNLSSAFVYNSDRELREDINRNYRFLARIIRQVLMRPTLINLDKRLTIKPLKELDQWLADGKSVIIAMGHVGNWEWAGLYVGMKNPGKVCALYKQIKSRPLNSWMMRRRLHLRGYLVESSKMPELLRLIRKKPVMILMIADQNPGNDKGILWTPFFNRLTAFANGPESLAVKYNLPVVYLRNTTLDNGSYQLEFEIISDGHRFLEHGEITRRYAEALENNIRSQRTEWLWSHKRWKREGENVSV